jgi:hypothetical protein
MGENTWLRLTERWTATAKSVFLFDVRGSVAKSTFAGLPWLLYLRNWCKRPIHFWPFDGWEIPEGKSVVAEVYPALWMRRFQTTKEGMAGIDEFDAVHLHKSARLAVLNIAATAATMLPLKRQRQFPLESITCNHCCLLLYISSDTYYLYLSLYIPIFIGSNCCMYN